MKPPLIPYLRKSSGEDPEQSRERQRRAIRPWAELNGEKLAPEVWEGHVSGSKPWQERALGRAISDCERGAASGIVVEEQSRLTRGSQLQVAELWEALDRIGARLVCVTEGIDTAHGDQELNFGLRALLAREQWKQYRRRVQSAKRVAVERGVHIGPAPFGYTREPHQPLEVVPEQAEAVRAAFELRASGASYGAVIRLLDERAPGGPSGRGAWNRGTVKRLLANETYLGRARGSDGPSREDAHPAVVDPETFAVCRALARRKEPAERKSQPHLLSGLVTCGSCGHALQFATVANGYKVYRCRGRSAEGICKAPVTAMADALEQLVDDAVLERPAIGWLNVEFVEGDSVDDDERVSGLRQRIEKARKRREPFEDPEYVELLGLDAAKRALASVDEEVGALEDELASIVVERRGVSDFASLMSETFGSALDVPPGIERARALRDQMRSLYDLDDPVSGGFYAKSRRDVLASHVERVIISRGKRGDLAGRTRIIWKGEDAPPRPSHARK